MPNCDHMLCLYNPKLLQWRRKKSNPKATSNNQIIINIENKLKKLESKLNYHFQFQTPLHSKRNACVEFWKKLNIHIIQYQSGHAWIVTIGNDSFILSKDLLHRPTSSSARCCRIQISLYLLFENSLLTPHSSEIKGFWST